MRDCSCIGYSLERWSNDTSNETPLDAVLFHACNCGRCSARPAEWVDIMEWYHWIIGVIVLLVIRDALAWLFNWNGDGIEIGSDPEGGAFGKMLNWHKRKRVYTSIRPDLGEDETTASGYVELSRPAKRRE